MNRPVANLLVKIGLLPFRYLFLLLWVVIVLLWPLILLFLVVIAAKEAFRRKPKPSEVDFEGTMDASFALLPIIEDGVTEGTPLL